MQDKKFSFGSIFDSASSRLKTFAKDSKPKFQHETDKANGIEFDFQFTGGPKQTDVCIASAFIKTGNAQDLLCFSKLCMIIF